MTKRALVRAGGAAALLGTMGWIVVGSPTSAFADSQPYELYCPGTPVGNIALNGVVTTATITPANPPAGSAFNVTNYSTTVVLPATIASAAAALGNTAVTGSATATLDVTGATPATKQTPTLMINTPLPNPPPTAGVTLNLPSPATSIGPFTASGGAISIEQDKSASLTLVVSGNNLSLTCTAYPNNTVATSGITQSTPSGSATSPVIATSTSSGAAPTATTTPSATPSATPTTTAAPVSSPSSNLAYTGTGPGIVLLGEIGFGGILAAGLMLIGYRARIALAAVHRGGRRKDMG